MFIPDTVIVYKRKEDGGISVIFPTDEVLEKYTLFEVAEKDVPEGCPYKIVPKSDLPEDWTFFSAWEIDDSELNDGVGNPYDTFMR